MLGALLVPLGLRATDWYISPTGSEVGLGTLAQPYDLTSALTGKLGASGDTFWLAGGTYALGHLDTKIQGAPGEPITFRGMPGEQARIDGSLTFYQSTGNVILRDLEIFSSDTNRLSSQTGVGFNPTDINIIPGISSYSPNMSFINLIVHDETRHGFYLSQMSASNLIYGCVVYNNGWASPDNAEGHGIYVQGTSGVREISDNVVFNNSGVNLHIYENASDYHLTGVILDGDVAFNAGTLQNVRVYRDWLVGVDPPAISADRIVFKNNLGYCTAAFAPNDQVQIGRYGVNGSVALLNNYLPLELEMNNWTIAAVAGNLFAAWSTGYVVWLDQSQVSLASAWNGNTYALPSNGNGFVNSADPALSPADWQTATGFDLNSTFSAAKLAGTKAFIRTNRFESGRANIIVYNWDNLTNVQVDVSSVLLPGAAYEVRNVEDYFGGPILSGLYDGKPLNLPMTGLTVAAPTAPLLTAPATGPTFNVFVLLPRSTGLQAALVSGQAQVSWPTNAGDWVLQSNSSLSNGSAWSDVAIPGITVGNRYVVTAPLTQSSGFYRLRAAP
ncbi:MAG: right-handed parallel beta-helix repeat-containing protein [Verrucomicrobia bacterium]|nr:right-handed parallel beta-helix repeat-containing protein [Verrucomicrobiota bacterium]